MNAIVILLVMSGLKLGLQVETASRVPSTFVAEYGISKKINVVMGYTAGFSRQTLTQYLSTTIDERETDMSGYGGVIGLKCRFRENRLSPILLWENTITHSYGNVWGAVSRDSVSLGNYSVDMWGLRTDLEIGINISMKLLKFPVEIEISGRIAEIGGIGLSVSSSWFVITQQQKLITVYPFSKSPLSMRFYIEI